MTNPMMQQRDINKTQAYIFMQRFYAYLLILRYFEFLSKISGNKTSSTDANGNTTYYEYNYKDQLTKVKDRLGNISWQQIAKIKIFGELNSELVTIFLWLP